MRTYSLLLWRSIIKQRCKSWRQATWANHRNTARISPHLVAVHERVSQRGKVNPVIRMQMRDRHRTDLRECTNANLRGERRIRAVAQIQHQRCPTVLYQVSRRTRAVVCAVRAR